MCLGTTSSYLSRLLRIFLRVYTLPISPGVDVKHGQRRLTAAVAHNRFGGRAAQQSTVSERCTLIGWKLADDTNMLSLFFLLPILRFLLFFSSERCL